MNNEVYETMSLPRVRFSGGRTVEFEYSMQRIAASLELEWRKTPSGGRTTGQRGGAHRYRGEISLGQAEDGV